MLYEPELKNKSVAPYIHRQLLHVTPKVALLLWRMGLGPLLGHGFAVISSEERKSDGVQRVALEYVAHKGKVYAICPLDERATWGEKLLAHPQVTLQTWQGAERMSVSRVVDNEELCSVLEGFMQRFPLLLGGYLGALDIPNTAESICERSDDICLLRFSPSETPTPFPLEVDLAWIWPVLLFVILGWPRHGKRRAQD